MKTLQKTPPLPVLALLATLLLTWSPLQAQINPITRDAIPGRTIESLLDYAKSQNPELAAIQLEAAAAAERIGPAGSLPDARFRIELRDITRAGEQDPYLLPGRVGSTRYQITQDLPWFGKLDLKREIAEFDAEGAKGKAQVTWSEVEAFKMNI